MTWRIEAGNKLMMCRIDGDRQHTDDMHTHKNDVFNDTYGSLVSLLLVRFLQLWTHRHQNTLHVDQKSQSLVP